MICYIVVHFRNGASKKKKQVLFFARSFLFSFILNKNDTCGDLVTRFKFLERGIAIYRKEKKNDRDQYQNGICVLVSFFFFSFQNVGK